MKIINVAILIVLTVSACSLQPPPLVENKEVKVDYKPIKLKLAQRPSRCSVTTELRYVQRNNMVGVDLGVAANENSSCKNSRGEFTLKIEFDNNENDRQVMEFAETWSRTENEALSFKLDYQIGFNTTLRSVKTIRSRCWCEEKETQTEQ